MTAVAGPQPTAVPPALMAAAGAAGAIAVAVPAPAPATPPMPLELLAKVTSAIRSCQDHRNRQAAMFIGENVAQVMSGLPKIRAEIQRQMDGETFYLRGKDHGLVRSVFGTKEHPYLLMSHCKRGGDRVVNTGSFKKVVYCIDLNTGERKVLGIMYKTPSKKHNATKQKLDILAKREFTILQHCAGIEHVVQARATLDRENNALLVMDECEEGDLCDAFIARENPDLYFTEQERLQIAFDLASGLEQIHARAIIYRDLKPDNVLLTRVDGRLRAKFCDFGLACFETARKARLENTGTPGYISRKYAQYRIQEAERLKQIKSLTRTNPEAASVKERVLIEDKLKIRTCHDDMDALGYLFFTIFHPDHHPMKHSQIENESLQTLAIANLTKAKLDSELRAIQPEYRAILEGIFFHDWTANQVRVALQDLMAQRMAPAPAAGGVAGAEAPPPPAGAKK